MKLFSFGGAEASLNQVPLEKALMKKTLIGLRPQSILYVPFAGQYHREKEWQGKWFEKLMGDSTIPILNAQKSDDLARATESVIFIPGGHLRRELLEKILATPVLLDLILNAKFIVTESSGSMIMVEYTRTNSNEEKIIKGLGILKNTIIEPHYKERNSEQLLNKDMKKSSMKYGIGIDCATAIVVNPQEFPAKWEKIGAGNISILTS